MNHRTLLIQLLCAAALLALPACKSEPPPITLPSGLQIIELEAGTGPAAKSRDDVEIRYEGRLEDGTLFDSSEARGTTQRFMLDAKRVMKGWDEGVMGMKVGGKRKLIIPPELGYPAHSRPSNVPAGATLIFEVELLRVRPPLPPVTKHDIEREEEWAEMRRAEKEAEQAGQAEAATPSSE